MKVGLIVVAGLVVVGLLVIANWNNIGQQIGGSCAVGVTGHAAMVQVAGWGASSSCSGLVAESQGGMYAYSGSIAIPVVCQEPLGRDLVTIFDEGSLDLLGGEMCRNLFNGHLTYYAAPTPTPTPLPPVPTPTPAPPTPHPSQPVITNTATSCWVHRVDANELVDVVGDGADQVCRQLIAGNVFVSADANFQPTDAESIACQVRGSDSYEYTIYDSGMQLFGTDDCTALKHGQTLTQ